MADRVRFVAVDDASLALADELGAPRPRSARAGRRVLDEVREAATARRTADESVAMRAHRKYLANMSVDRMGYTRPSPPSLLAAPRGATNRTDMSRWDVGETQRCM